jgi:hypothetical protein
LCERHFFNTGCQRFRVKPELMRANFTGVRMKARRLAWPWGS